MERKLPFKYYATRVGNSIVFRRTVNKLYMVKSQLYKPYTDFHLIQIGYTGGRIVATMPYKEWTRRGGSAINIGRYAKVPREQFKALSPFMQCGDL